MKELKRKIQQGDVLFKEVDPKEFKEKLKEAKETNKKNNSDWYTPDMEIRSQYYNYKAPEGPLDGARCTVALGEATGHHHSFEDGTPGVVVTAYKARNVDWSSRLHRDNPAQCHYVSVESDDMQGYGVITHQEHNPVQVPAGYYKIEIVKEFDHFSQMERRVVD